MEKIEELFQCSRCKEHKHIIDFHIRSSRKKGISSACKKCLAVTRLTKHEQFRMENPLPLKKTKLEKLSTRKKIRHKQRSDFRMFMNELKSGPCIDCGKLFAPECMDFDHLDGYKRECIEFNELRGAAKSKILAEIAKCELVCSNCHRIRTHLRIFIKNNYILSINIENSRRKSSQIAKKKFYNLINSFRTAPCQDCNKCYPFVCMDFDHIDSTTKKYNVTSMLHCEEKDILKEIAKCELVCSNCHRSRTKERKNTNKKHSINNGL